MNTEYTTELNKFANDIYPRTEEEATAERMIRHSTARAMALLLLMDTIDPTVDDKLNPLWTRTLTAMQGSYDKRVALAALMEVDPAKADEVARDSWLAADAGDSYGEWLWQWAIESDIPVSPESLDGKTQAETKAEMETNQAHRAALKLDVEEAMLEIRSLPESYTGVQLGELWRHVMSANNWTEERTKAALNHAYTWGHVELVDPSAEGEDRHIRLTQKDNR